MEGTQLPHRLVQGHEDKFIEKLRVRVFLVVSLNHLIDVTGSKAHVVLHLGILGNKGILFACYFEFYAL